MADFGILMEDSEISIPSVNAVPNYVLPNSSQRRQHLRVHPLILPPESHLLPSEVLMLSNKFYGFVYKSHFKINALSSQDYVFVQLFGYSKVDTELNSQRSTTIKLFFIEDSDVTRKLAPFGNIPCIFLHSEFIQEANLEQKSWTWIRAVSAVPESVETLLTSCSGLPKYSNSNYFSQNKNDFRYLHLILLFSCFK